MLLFKPYWIDIKIDMAQKHHYSAKIVWTGNLGKGTADYRAYTRDHEIRSPGKAVIAGSSDPNFRGDAARYNPEELLVSSLSACHMLWYLHLCSDAGLIVESYDDEAEGVMETTSEGDGRFVRVTLHPNVCVTGPIEQAESLHHRAHELCFIANSVNFPVEHQATIRVSP
jgi:organic hydroperoxide reductase OsmC/OhrA